MQQRHFIATTVMTECCRTAMRRNSRETGKHICKWVNKRKQCKIRCWFYPRMMQTG